MSAPTDGYVLYDANGKKIGYGTGRPETRDGETFIYSTDPRNEQDSVAIRDELAAREDVYRVEQWKTEQEYAGKAENAIRWLANNQPVIGPFPLISALVATLLQIDQHNVGDFTEESYRWLWIEVNARGVTPRVAAEDIVAAIIRDDDSDMGAWHKANQRCLLREQLRGEP